MIREPAAKMKIYVNTRKKFRFVVDGTRSRRGAGKSRCGIQSCGAARLAQTIFRRDHDDDDDSDYQRNIILNEIHVVNMVDNFDLS